MELDRDEAAEGPKRGGRQRAVEEYYKALLESWRLLWRATSLWGGLAVRLRVAVLSRETADQESQQALLRRGRHAGRRAGGAKGWTRRKSKADSRTLTHWRTQGEESKKEWQAGQRRFDERCAWQVG